MQLAVFLAPLAHLSDPLAGICAGILATSALGLAGFDRTSLRLSVKNRTAHLQALKWGRLRGLAPASSLTAVRFAATTPRF